MKCMRIFPETCASTVCPVGNMQRKRALGSASFTVASTVMGSGLGKESRQRGRSFSSSLEMASIERSAFTDRRTDSPR